MYNGAWSGVEWSSESTISDGRSRDKKALTHRVATTGAVERQGKGRGDGGQTWKKTIFLHNQRLIQNYFTRKVLKFLRN